MNTTEIIVAAALALSVVVLLLARRRVGAAWQRFKARRSGKQAGATRQLNLLGSPKVEKIEPSPAIEETRLPQGVAGIRALCEAMINREYEWFIKQKTSIERQRASCLSIIAAAQQRNYPDTRALPTVVYLAIMLFAGACDFAMLSVVFQVLGQNMTATYIMAGSVGLGLPLLAHFAGSIWKRGRKEDQPKMWAAVGAAMAMLFGVAIIREYFMSPSIERYIGVQISPTVVTIVFFVIGAGIFFACMLAAHAHSRVNPRGEQLTKRADQATEKLADLDKALAQLIEKFCARCQYWSNEYLYLADLWNAANMKKRRRNGSEQPKWVDHIVPIPVPDYAGLVDSHLEAHDALEEKALIRARGRIGDGKPAWAPKMMPVSAARPAGGSADDGESRNETARQGSTSSSGIPRTSSTGKMVL